MWGFYGASIAFFGQAVCGPRAGMGCALQLAEFLYLTPGNGPQTLLEFGYGNIAPPVMLYMLLGVLPLAAIVFYLWRRRQGMGLTRWFHSAPILKLNIFLNPADELAFLRAYARAGNAGPLLAAFRANQDIAVLKNLAGGSAATTLLAQQGDDVFYRKYAIGPEAEKLERQHAWMSTQAGHLAVAPVLRTGSSKGFFSYDMPFDPSCYGLFDYIHTHPVQTSWGILQNVLNDLESKLHKPTQRQLTRQQAHDYIQQKLIGPVEKAIGLSPLLAELAGHEYLRVNGQTIRSASALLKDARIAELADKLDLKMGATVHGDVTVENIVHNPLHPHGYYLIDPLTENVFESKYLDSAQLLQSLDSGYEFLTRLSRVTVEGPRVDFPLPVSAHYAGLRVKLRAHLKRRHGAAGWWEIRLHHAVKMARILPYRCHHQPQAVAAYYAILSQLIAEVLEGSATSRQSPHPQSAGKLPAAA